MIKIMKVSLVIWFALLLPFTVESAEAERDANVGLLVPGEATQVIAQAFQEKELLAQEERKVGEYETAQDVKNPFMDRGVPISGTTLVHRRERSIAISSDSRFIVTGSHDGIVTIWDAQTDEQMNQFFGYGGGEITFVRISSDNKFIVTGSFDDRKIVIWDLQTGKPIHKLFGPRYRLSSMDLSSDNRCIVTGYSDGRVLLWDVQTGEQLHELLPGQKNLPWLLKKSYAVSVAISPDSSFIVTGSASDNRGVTVWNAQTGKQLYEFVVDGRVVSVEISSDNRFIIVAINKNIAGFDQARVLILDAHTGQQLSELIDARGRIEGVAISPDNSFVLGSSNNHVIIWDMQTGEERFQLSTSGPIMKDSIAISLDSKFIVTGSKIGRAIIWDAQTGSQVHELIGHKPRGETVWSSTVAISPDRRFVLTQSPSGISMPNQTSEDFEGIVQIWRPEPFELMLERARKRLEQAHRMIYFPIQRSTEIEAWIAALESSGPSAVPQELERLYQNIEDSFRKGLQEEVWGTTVVEQAADLGFSGMPF